MSFWSGPPQTPPLETQFFELLRGGVGGGQKSTPPFLGPRIMNLLVFFYLSQKSVSGFRLHGVCMGRSGTSAYAVYALSSHFWYVGGFGDLGGGGLVHNLLMQFFTLDSSKIEVFETCCFDVVIT